jgi:hypothetical protein
VTIELIVEGHGEVEAVPVLLRRLRDEGRASGLEFGRPMRRKRSELIQEDAVRKAVRLALLRPECRGILILFDADDDCPAEMAPVVQGWAQAEAGPIPVAVVMPCREYEAWFLAAIESLRGFRGVLARAASHPEPESPRSAKGELEERMQTGRSYAETADQAGLTARFNLAAAYARCRSFRRLVRAFGLLAQQSGHLAGQWPPPPWVVED